MEEGGREEGRKGEESRGKKIRKRKTYSNCIKHSSKNERENKRN